MASSALRLVLEKRAEAPPEDDDDSDSDSDDSDDEEGVSRDLRAFILSKKSVEVLKTIMFNGFPPINGLSFSFLMPRSVAPSRTRRRGPHEKHLRSPLGSTRSMRRVGISPLGQVLTRRSASAAGFWAMKSLCFRSGSIGSSCGRPVSLSMPLVSWSSVVPVPSR